MKTKYEVDDVVKVTSTDSFGIASKNKVGGTEIKPKGTMIQCTIIREWYDYETGQRYVGVDKNHKEFYFGEFGVNIQPA